MTCQQNCVLSLVVCHMLIVLSNADIFQIILANTGDPQASHVASKLSETVAKVNPLLPSAAILQASLILFISGDLHRRARGREGDPDLPGDEAPEVLQHQHRPALRHEGRTLRLRFFSQLNAETLRRAAEQQTSGVAESPPLLHNPFGHQHSQQSHRLQVSHLLKVTPAGHSVRVTPFTFSPAGCSMTTLGETCWRSRSPPRVRSRSWWGASLSTCP